MGSEGAPTLEWAHSRGSCSPNTCCWAHTVAAPPSKLPPQAMQMNLERQRLLKVARPPGVGLNSSVPSEGILALYLKATSCLVRKQPLDRI